MPLNWVPWTRTRSRADETRFNRSLVRNVLIVLLVLSFFPLLLVGTLNYFRSRDLLRKQISRQLENISQHEAGQLEQYVELRASQVDRLVTDAYFQNQLFALVTSPPDTFRYTDAQAFLSFRLKANPQVGGEDYFDQMVLFSTDGELLLSTEDAWVLERFGERPGAHPLVKELLGKNRSIFTIDRPSSGDTAGLVLYTARSFIDEQGNLAATLIASAPAGRAAHILNESSSFLPGAFSLYFDYPSRIIRASGETQFTRANYPELAEYLTLLTGESPARISFTTRVQDGVPILACARWFPEWNIGILLGVSERTVLEQNTLFDPFNLLLVGFAFVLTGGLVYFGSTRLVNPLLHLAEVVNLFSQGNWSERARVKRNDEIGLLAFSFNRMADQLSELYQSLESVVDRRTRQLRIASEVAQLAISSARLNEILSETARLIGDRFGFDQVAIYLEDEAGQTLVLRQVSGVSGEAVLQPGEQLSVDENTLPGWAAVHNQARIVTDIQWDPLARRHELLPDIQTEAAIPVASGSEVLGVLEIRSAQFDAFDPDTVSVLETLASQIASTLQQARQIETAENLSQETALLYQATRAIGQARGEADLVQRLADTFVQLPFFGAVLSVEEEKGKVLFVTDPDTGRVEKNLQNLAIPAGQAASRLVENKIALIEDLSQPNDYETVLAFLLRRGCQSAALLGVLTGGRLSKIIALGAREQNQITRARLQPYANLAEVVAAALEKQTVLDALQKRLAELQILASFNQSISAETDLNNLYRVLHEQVIQTFGPDLEFGVALYSQAKNLVEFPYYFEKGAPVSIPPFPLGDGLTSVLLQSRKPMLLPDQASIQASSGIQIGDPAKSWMGIPLIFGGDVIGAIIVQDLYNEQRFQQEDLNLLMTLAPQTATAVRNTQLFTETQQALRAYDLEHFLLNNLLDNMPEGIAFKDTGGRYVRASQSVARLYHVTAEEMVGRTDGDFLSEAAAAQVYQDEQRVLESGSPEIGAIQPVQLDRQTIAWIHTSRIPIRLPSGEPYGLLIIQRDVTGLKQAETLAQRRAGQVTTAAEIARDATGTLEVDTLLQKAVNLIRDRFGFYHASIFLLDTDNQYAVLRESTGMAGQQMLQSGHRLAVGSKSIVGQVSASGEALIVNDVAGSPTHLPNPLLLDTRSELAIPLIASERTLGVLDVQSRLVDAFNNEDVSVLQILADQLAVALVNGELFAKTQELLGKHRLLRQISIAVSAITDLEDALVQVVKGLLTARAGERIAILMLNEAGMLHVQASAGYEGAGSLELLVAPGQGIPGQAAVEKRPVRVDNTLSDPRASHLDRDVRSALAIPILFNDNLLGILNLESARVAAFDENDVEILDALANHLGAVIANIRLIDQARRQVARERQLFDVTSKIRRSVDLQTILETSTREICRAVGARRAKIQITAGEALPEPDDRPATNGQDGPGNGHKPGWSD
jgi:PAS domain S-box-containing protein